MTRNCNTDCSECLNFIKPNFRDISIWEDINLKDYKILNSYVEGELVIRKGAPYLGVFCIQSGSVKAQYEDLDHVEKERILNAGDFIGVRNMDLEYTDYWARALEELVVCFFDKAFMEVVLEDDRFRTLYFNKCIF